MSHAFRVPGLRLVFTGVLFLLVVLVGVAGPAGAATPSADQLGHRQAPQITTTAEHAGTAEASAATPALHGGDSATAPSDGVGSGVFSGSVSGFVATRGAKAADDAASQSRTVAIGRNMEDRVVPYAEARGYDWYRGTPRGVPRTAIERISPRALERTDLWFNRRWIRGEMRGGSRIVDIGEPPGYRPSQFYDMELEETTGYWNYVPDPQP